MRNVIAKTRMRRCRTRKAGGGEKMHELKIRMEDELYIRIADVSYDGILITDHEGLILYFNDAYLRISGLKSGELAGQYMQKLIAGKSIPDSCSLDAINEKRPVSKLIDYYSGVSALVTSTPVFNEAGDLLRIFSNVRDITELVKLQEKLQSTSLL